MDNSGVLAIECVAAGVSALIEYLLRRVITGYSKHRGRVLGRKNFDVGANPEKHLVSHASAPKGQGEWNRVDIERGSGLRCILARDVWQPMIVKQLDKLLHGWSVRSAHDEAEHGFSGALQDLNHSLVAIAAAPRQHDHYCLVSLSQVVVHQRPHHVGNLRSDR